jgi:glucose/arabinose dehydrogenase
LKPSYSSPRSSLAHPLPTSGAGPALVESLERRELLTTLPSGFAETQIATGFASPTAMTIAPDGRIFVAEQAGQLRVIRDGALLPTPFVTLPTEAVQERGFGGVVLDPNFAQNGYIYVYYTALTPDIHNRVSRYTADPANPDRALAGSEQVLFEIDGFNGAGYHQGGAIHFGPDGMLYVAVGDHGSTTRAQSLSYLFGKVLRINPNGSIPTDNPFYNQASGNKRAIWALGLRNPFTFAFQPGTGTMYINDVGQNLWEEINEGAAGANYGWPTAEGPSTDTRFVPPIHAIPHPEARAITGADFYNPVSAQFPTGYGGAFFFGDLDKRWIRRLDPVTRQATGFATALPGEPIDIDVADDGSLFYLLRPLDAIRVGGVYRVSYAVTGAPSISAQPQPAAVVVGRPATFTVQASGAEPLAYQWQRNGVDIPGATAASYTVAAAVLADSGAQFRVRVFNASGSVTSNAATLTVTDSGVPTASISSPASGALFRAGETISYSGEAIDPDDGTLPAGAFTWQVDYITAGILRPLVAPTTGSRSGSFTVPTLTPYTGTDVLYRVTLTVRDSSGLTHTTSRDLLPRTSAVGLATNVPGLRLALDGQPVAAPSSFTGVEGFERLLGAPATHTVNGVTYAFESWSDGGAAEHGINTPADDTVFTAIYRALDDGSENPPNSPDLTLTLADPQRMPTSALTGTGSRARVRISNASETAATGVANVGLYLSADEYLDPGDPLVAMIPRKLRLRPGGAQTLSLPFTFPESVGAGSYRLLAWADAGKAVAERTETNNVASSAAAIALTPAVRDFSATFSQVAVTPGRIPRGSATLLVRYDGNIAASGPLAIELRASSDANPDAADTVIATLTRRVRMQPGATRVFRLRFLPRGLASGTYYVTAVIDSGGAFTESNESNNTAVSETIFAIG